MATALAIPEPGTLPAKFKPSDVAIAQLAQRYMPLVIQGAKDTEGYAEVHSARMVVKGHRVDIEKTRKALKEDALKYGRLVDSEAKRLTALLEPIEQHLTNEESRIDDEKEKIRNAARLKAEQEAREKAEAEAAKLRAEQEAEASRLRAEREKLDAERKALDFQRAVEDARRRSEQEKLDAEREAMEAERAKVEAGQRRLAKIEEDRQRAVELEKARKEAAAQAERLTKERMEREAREQIAAEKRRAEAAEAARVRAEAMRPDKEKLLAVAEAVENIDVPDAPDVSRESWQFAKRIRLIVDGAAETIRNIVAEME